MMAAALPFAAALALATLPGLGERGEAGWRAFLESPAHRAFVVAPGGAWAWSSGEATADAALDEALFSCRAQAGVDCHAFALDDRMVFDRTAWEALWTASTTGQASAAPVGTLRGERFPDLALTGPDGRPTSLGALRGQVVFLHFWASWCPPCQVEMPDLWRLAREAPPGVAVVPVQLREPVGATRAWLARKGFDLPVWDSGAAGRGDSRLSLADRRTIEDDALATVYPTTYVLDANGVIAFAHSGRTGFWPDYAPLLAHLSRGTPH